MAPKIGDVVFVAQHNEYDNADTVSPAIVTHVYTENDGDPRWWDAARDKEIVDATVLSRGGTPVSGTFGKSETVTVDDGQGGTITYPVGYATTPDGHADSTADPANPVTTVPSGAAPSTGTAAAQGLSDADIARLAAAMETQRNTEPTQTVGDGADVATPTGQQQPPPTWPGFPRP